MISFLSVTLFSFLVTANHAVVKRKNVVFIICDDLRPALGAYGDKNAFTPNIDKLANKSVLFSNVFVQQALCAPSRNSILTGRRPDTLRLYDFNNYWRTTIGNFTTLPEYFKQHGYQTISIGKVFHPGVSSNYSDDYPYSWSTEPYHAKSEKYLNAAVCFDPNDGLVHENLLCPVDLHLFPGHTLPDIESTLKAKEFLIKAHKSVNPFFLAVGFHKPHIPFQVPRKYLDFHPIEKFVDPDDDFKPYDLPNVAWNPFNDLRKRDDVAQLNLSFPFGTLPKDFRRKTRQHYYASVTYIDDLIGQVLKDIDMRDTVIVLTSDHGWSLGEHAEWAKYSNFDVAVKVPLLIYDPSLALSQTLRVTSVVESLDIFPTLVDLVGLQEIPHCSEDQLNHETCVEGKSLMSLIKNDQLVQALTALSQYPRPSDYPTKYPDSDKPKLKQIKIMGYSIRDSRFRYTAWIGFNSKTFQRDWSKIFAEELYDHSFDRDERINLAVRHEFDSIKQIMFNKLKNKVKQ